MRVLSRRNGPDLRKEMLYVIDPTGIDACSEDMLAIWRERFHIHYFANACQGTQALSRLSGPELCGRSLPSEARATPSSSEHMFTIWRERCSCPMWFTKPVGEAYLDIVCQGMQALS